MWALTQHLQKQRNRKQSTNLHGVPWLKRTDQVQTFIRFFGGWSPAAELVAVEQTPATGSEAGQHARSSLFVCLKSNNNHPECSETSCQLQHHQTQVFSNKETTSAPSGEAEVTRSPRQLREMIWVLKDLNTIILFCPPSQLL